MKKVLSVLLAAAMVMGMSVTSFAATDDTTYKTFGSGSGTNDTDVSAMVFEKLIIVDENSNVKETVYSADGTAIANVDEGDVFYFPVFANGQLVTGAADSNWKIRLKDSDDYVKSATFSLAKTTSTSTLQKNLIAKLGTGATSVLFVKVTLEDDVDVLDASSYFTFCIRDYKDDVTSEPVKTIYNFITTSTDTLYEDELDWALEVGSHPTKYTYHEDEKAAYATINFDDIAYGEFKMYPDEKYTLAVDTDYNKTLSQEWDTDVDVIDFTLTNVGNIDIVLLADEDEYQVVAVVDGELVPVEAEYVEDHEFKSGEEATGYLVENAEYTQYALIDADVEIVVAEEVEVETETTVETEKANPETGASDFVGAAVALAVVSVAAAGALALKK